MQNNTSQPNNQSAPTQTQLDPQVVNLTKAIRQTESGGNFQAQGKSGEYGAYQYTQPTWDIDSQKYIGQKVNLQDATPEQQNEVAYKKIADLKSQGMNIGQIASYWNSNDPEAYQGKFSTNTATHKAGDPSTGVNSYGVKYDVPAYAKSVATAYQTLKNGGQVNQDPNNPSSVSAQPTQDQNTNQGNQDWLSKTSDFLDNIFGGKKVGELIGGLYEKATLPADQAKYVDLPSTEEVLGSAGKSALTLGSLALGPEAIGLPETILGRLGFGSAVGAGLGATGTMSEGGNAQDVGKGALVGGIAGLAGGALGETASKLLKFLPKSIVQNALKGADESTINSALEKPFMTIQSGLETAHNEISQSGNAISKLLDEADTSGVRGAGNDAAKQTLVNFQDSRLFQSNKGEPLIPSNANLMESMNAQQGITDAGNAIAMKNLGKTLKQAAPENAGIVDKVLDGSATLQEKNSLRQELDSATYDTRDPNSTFRKSVAKKMADNLRREVQSWVPGTQKHFKDLTKNIALRDALEIASKKAGASKGIGLKDIAGIMAGSAVGGPIGGAAGYGVAKFAESPGAEMAVAKGLQKVSNASKSLAPVGKALKTGGINYLISALQNKS